MIRSLSSEIPEDQVPSSVIFAAQRAPEVLYNQSPLLRQDALYLPHSRSLYAVKIMFYSSQRYFLLYDLRTLPKCLVPAVPLIFPQRMQSMLCILPITSAHAVMYMAHGAKNKMWTVQYDPLQPVNLPSSAAFSHNGFSKYFYH